MPPELQTQISSQNEVGLQPPSESDLQPISDKEIQNSSEKEAQLNSENQLEIPTENGVQEGSENEAVYMAQEEELSPEEEAAIRKQIAIEMRKAELRRRMEEASKARKAKKGFMTPERKKKLRLLLRKKAAEELKKEQERKAEERRWIIEDRCGDPEDLDWASKEDLKDICEDYFQRILECESDKWDLEYEMRKRAFEISELNSKVNDLRGKFQRPILKKVSKYENKFSLLQRKAAEFNYRNQLKMVKRPEYILKEDEKRSHLDKLLDKRQRTESEALEEAEKASVKGEEVERSSPDEGAIEKLSTGGEGDVAAEEQSTSVEADTALPEEEPRLEGDPVEGEPGVEGEQRSGGQSPLEGEVQPTEPPPPPEPIHTEEDLWLYLKETVTSVHPATVEEFVQNLIGTLQQVPEEYLKPVIDANIKRATSPSVTDGEPQPILEDTHQEVLDNSVPLEGSTIVEGETELTGEPIGEETQVPEGESTISFKEEPLNISEELAIGDERPEATEGYSAVEATA